MSVNGQQTDVLHWQHKLLSADDLRRHLNGHRSLVLSPTTLITPLALDELRSRNISVTRADAKSPTPACRLALAQEFAIPMIQAAAKGLSYADLPPCSQEITAWVKSLSQKLAQNDYAALAVFCTDPAHVACLANKNDKIRAAAVYMAAHANRALKSFAANFLAVEMPGRTFFEIRQILAALSKEAAHAHR